MPANAPAPTPTRTAAPADRAGRRRVTATVVVVAIAVVLTVVATSGGGGPSTPPPVTDLAAEDAVVAVLQLFVAEEDLTAAVAAGSDPFALPGPTARAAGIDEAVAAHRRVLSTVRADPPGPGTPAEDYVADGDHEALARVAGEVAAHLRLLGFLDDVHRSLYGGAGVVAMEEARRVLQDQLDTGGLPPAAAAWARGLRIALDGTPDPQLAATDRVAAAAEWQARAGAIGPADSADLVAFLNGVDPGVLAALDGHPLAGPALRALR